MIEANGLPKGWATTSLSNCSSRITDGTHLPPEFVESGVPFLFIKHIVKGRLTFDDTRFISVKTWQRFQSRCPVEFGDILYTAVGSYGVAVVVATEQPFSFQRHIAHIKPLSQLNARYLALFLNSPFGLGQAHRVAKGVAQKTVTLADLKRFSVNVAPLDEQNRIVAKIEELFSDLDAGVAALKRAKANLKRYRAAVLKAAVEGKLTEEWRATHPSTESASKLLARILTERRQKWEADQLAKFDAAGKEPSKNWKDKYVEPSPPDATDLPELPDGWCWASVQQVGSVQLGRQRAPQHHSGQHMRPYLRVANVFEDRIDVSDVMEMNFTPDEFETYRLSYGDILLNEGQSMELIGRPAMYRDEVPGACFTNTLVRFRPLAGVAANYALKVFLAYLKNGRFQKIATITVNIAHLGAGRFSEIEFPLPPIEEQAAIVAEVDRHFSLIDAAEIETNRSLLRAARLRQSILKQAFEGKLVTQDPDDEPASALLERLRAGAATHEGNGKAVSPSSNRGRRTKPKQKELRAAE